MNAHAKIELLRRATLEAYIEELIVLLDTLDGDPDLEDDEIEANDEREPVPALIRGGAGA